MVIERGFALLIVYSQWYKRMKELRHVLYLQITYGKAFSRLERSKRDSDKMAVFWVVAPCSLVEVYQRFRGPCGLHHH
jgi:hypothetical protein